MHYSFEYISISRNWYESFLYQSVSMHIFNLQIILEYLGNNPFVKWFLKVFPYNNTCIKHKNVARQHLYTYQISSPVINIILKMNYWLFSCIYELFYVLHFYFSKSLFTAFSFAFNIQRLEFKRKWGPV